MSSCSNWRLAGYLTRLRAAAFWSDLKHINLNRWRFPEEWPKEIPSGFRQVLDRLLAKSPDDRYQFYGQLRDDLQRLRPTTLPRAGRLQRAAAWLVDLALVMTWQRLLFFIPWDRWAWTASFVPGEKSGPGEIAECVLALAPLTLFLLLQIFWQSPGKHLFRIRIVDAIGGDRLDWRTLLGRGVWQMAPGWVSTLVAFLAIYGQPSTMWLIGLSVLLGIPLLVDAIFALFRRNGVSLHDQYFETRVVLDITDSTGGRI